MPRESFQQGTTNLRPGSRVRVVSGGDRGATGVITSVLADRGVTYYQVALVGDDGTRRGEGGLFREPELEAAGVE